MRKHGFQLPLNFFQISSFSLFLGSILIFCIRSVDRFESAEKGFLYGVFSFLSISVTTFYIITTWVDPSDDGKVKDLDQSYCTLCASIKNVNSKHCARCDRCTLEFDHHCKWVNNCVGVKNYRYFVALIVSAELFCIFFTTTNGLSIFHQIRRSESPDIVSLVFLFVFEVFGIVGVGFLGHLISLHIFLRVKKMTTFEYILSKRKKLGSIYKSQENVSPDTYVKTDNSNDVTKTKN